MTEPASYYVTKDWQRFVPEGDPEAAFGVAPVDIDRLGLRERFDAFRNPPAEGSPRPADKRRRFPDTSPRRVAPTP